VTGPAVQPPAPPRGPDGQSFDTALRGYERRQVDEFVNEKQKEVSRLRMELADAQRQHRRAKEHAEATEVELRELRAKSAHTEPMSMEDSFGYRAEKLLRMAESEAADARNHASRESAAIIEQARTEAEKHRHEAEQTLISRASLLEQQAAQRTAELQERELQIADQLTAAREQADQLHAAAARTADRLRQESEAAAAETRLQAETAAQRQRDQAAQEIGRLTALQSDVRAELARLAAVLSAELSNGAATAQGHGEHAGATDTGEEDAAAEGRSAALTPSRS